MRDIQFIDLHAQRTRLGDRLTKAVQRVIDHGHYIMGPEVGELERSLAHFSGARHAISCANGTDALQLVLMGWSIGPGDAVFVPSFTFASTAEVVALVGATPVFVDVLPHSFNMDPDHLARAIAETVARGRLRPRAIIAVDLFGLAADYTRLVPLAARHGLKLLCDSAQAFGARHKGRRTGTFGDATTTSFFPAKPLGCYGDGGAIFTEDDALAATLRSLRVHGQGSDKYDNVRIGMNGRLDTMQAAILLEKLAIYEDEIERRQLVAGRYGAALSNRVTVPAVDQDSVSVWAQYTIRVPDRAAVQAKLKEAGIPTAVYYPRPLHRQTAYRDYPTGPDGLPASDTLANEVLSLPMHPYLDEKTQAYIVDILQKILKP